MYKIHNKINMYKIHKGKTYENELCQKPHKNSQPPKTPKNLPKTSFAKNPTKILGTRLHHFDAFPTSPTIYFFSFFSCHPFKYRRKSCNHVTELIINTLIAYKSRTHRVPNPKIAYPKTLKINRIFLY